ncbi:MAG TPA: protein TolQ [Rhizomicrobium sp.]|jgi:biopolymer transport protein TolQ|nr:protein TolQ [Rhizomicrobium sp.]
MKFAQAAVWAAAILLILVCLYAQETWAQSTPRAAPTGPDAQTQQLGAPQAAPTTPVDVTPGGEELGPGFGGISIYSLFMRADPVVKTVMALLAVASLWSWAIVFSKWIALGSLRRRADKFEKSFWSGTSLDDLYQQYAPRIDHPMVAVFASAIREWRRAFEGGAPRESRLASIKDRIDKAMSVTIQRESQGIERQLGFLATVGATAPFVGLFGTVWGIMNSFSAIAARHDTTLAVVAPGIAEALFATAMGLLAAIPAVIFYNKFVNDIGRYVGRLESFADEFSAILSRQLDEKAA